MKYFLYLFLIISFSANAQKNYVIKYKGSPKPVYSKKSTINNNLFQNLHGLANKITKSKFGEAEKVEAIYLWIASNITYDHELRFNKRLQKDYYHSKEKVIAKVLERQKALCGGYAFLFEALCHEIGIEAKTVHGYTKLTNNFRQPNHSWNAVKINGKWQLLDITWSISNGTKQNPDKYWYFTNPKIFIRSHYPQDRKWALLEEPPSLDEFVS